MSVVSIAEAWPSSARPFTVADLDRMPDDGHRYELLDGTLPSWIASAAGASGSDLGGYRIHPGCRSDPPGAGECGEMYRAPAACGGGPLASYGADRPELEERGVRAVRGGFVLGRRA